MISVDFFPSKTIARYMAKTFVLRTLAVLAALVLILQTLDLLGESGKILAVPGNGDAELWRYVSLRIPQLIGRFLPFSVLLGTLITFATLNQHSEVISMKAAGISAHQIIAPLILASLVIAGVTFAFQERIVTRANATLGAWEAVEYRPLPPATGRSSNVWVRSDDDLIHVAAVSGRGAGTRLSDVTVYRRSGETLQTVIEAKQARPLPGGGWELREAEIFDVARAAVRREPRLVDLAATDPDQFAFARVDAEELDFASLYAVIDDMKAAGRSTDGLQAGLWHKLSGPLSAALMPLLAAIAAFGLARSGQLFLRAIVGMALGFAYFVADNFAIAMGNLGAYPPFLAAWAPFLLFLLIGETVLVRTEE
jgi:lipopolysaccharide export system permease protein